MDDVHATLCVALSVGALHGWVRDSTVLFMSAPYVAWTLRRYAARGNATMVIHHALTLALYALALVSDVNPLIHASSRVLLIEASAVPLHWWKRKPRSALRFWTMALVYGLNRPLYLGWLVWWSPIATVMLAADPASVVMLWGGRLLHLGLCVWFGKICAKFITPRSSQNRPDEMK